MNTWAHFLVISGKLCLFKRKKKDLNTSVEKNKKSNYPLLGDGGRGRGDSLHTYLPLLRHRDGSVGFLRHAIPVSKNHLTEENKSLTYLTYHFLLIPFAAFKKKHKAIENKCYTQNYTQTKTTNKSRKNDTSVL